MQLHSPFSLRTTKVNNAANKKTELKWQTRLETKIKKNTQANGKQTQYIKNNSDNNDPLIEPLDIIKQKRPRR